MFFKSRTKDLLVCTLVVFAIMRPVTLIGVVATFLICLPAAMAGLYLVQWVGRKTGDSVKLLAGFYAALLVAAIAWYFLITPLYWPHISAYFAA